MFLYFDLSSDNRVAAYWEIAAHSAYDMFSKYTHGNKLGNTFYNVTTSFGLYISFFVRIMKNILTA